jgi:hypothetical protein
VPNLICEKSKEDDRNWDVSHQEYLPWWFCC